MLTAFICPPLRLLQIAVVMMHVGRLNINSDWLRHDLTMSAVVSHAPLCTAVPS
jgi:hypothetical protein